MNMKFMSMCKQPPVLPLPEFFTRKFDTNILNIPSQPKDKVVFVLGPTGSGKSRLSIDLATRFPAEIINSDKIQVHKGLQIVTNKVTEEECRGVPHHLLDVLDPNVDFSATDFCHMATRSVESILSIGRLPIIVGGSNSYIEALVDDDDCMFRSKYDCCFLWVDVSMDVLHKFVSKRVDKMVENGMVEEVREFFDFTNTDYSRGIRKAIGVPEFDMYFRVEQFLDRHDRTKFLHRVIQEVKDNTCKLSRRQLEKIHRLRRIKKWNIHRIDATGVFQSKAKEAEEEWDRAVAGRSTEIVARFLLDNLIGDREHILKCLVA